MTVNISRTETRISHFHKKNEMKMKNKRLWRANIFDYDHQTRIVDNNKIKECSIKISLQLFLFATLCSDVRWWRKYLLNEFEVFFKSWSCLEKRKWLENSFFTLLLKHFWYQQLDSERSERNSTIKMTKCCPRRTPFVCMIGNFCT